MRLIPPVIGFIILILTVKWTDRNLDFWISHFKGKPVDVDLWISIVAIIVAPVALLVNLSAEIARYLV